MNFEALFRELHSLNVVKYERTPEYTTVVIGSGSPPSQWMGPQPAAMPEPIEDLKPARKSALDELPPFPSDIDAPEWVERDPE